MGKGDMMKGEGVDDDVEGSGGEVEDAVGHGEECDVISGVGCPGLCQGSFVGVHGHHSTCVAGQVAGDAAGAAPHFEKLFARQAAVGGDGEDILVGGVLDHGALRAT